MPCSSARHSLALSAVEGLALSAVEGFALSTVVGFILCGVEGPLATRHSPLTPKPLPLPRKPEPPVPCSSARHSLALSAVEGPLSANSFASHTSSPFTHNPFPAHTYAKTGGVPPPPPFHFGTRPPLPWFFRNIPTFTLPSDFFSVSSVANLPAGRCKRQKESSRRCRLCAVDCEVFPKGAWNYFGAKKR